MCRGVIHCFHSDLKPENLIFETPDEDSELKVIDFGLSKMNDIVSCIL